MRPAMLSLLTAFTLTTPTLSQQPAGLRMEPATVRDSQAVHQDAIRLLKPQGWNLSGGVKWYHELAHLACVEITIADPNSKAQIETFPWHYCTWIKNPVMPMTPGTNYLGSIVARPMDDPGDVVERITLPTLRRGLNARITGHTAMPKVAADLARQFEPGTAVKAARTRVEYTLDGVEMEEGYYFTVFLTHTRLFGNTVSTLWGPAWVPFSLRAEKGKLDELTPLMLASVNSARINENWFAEFKFVSQLFANRQLAGIIAAGRLSDHIARNSDEIRRLYSDAYRERNAAMDRVAARFSDYIRGTERYHNPAESHPVQLPGGYRDVWYGSNGTYLLSNEAGHNPNVGSTVTWQRLEAVK